jgi:hypothetical protein
MRTWLASSSVIPLVSAENRSTMRGAPRIWAIASASSPVSRMMGTAASGSLRW